MVEIRNYHPSDFPQVKEVLEKGGIFWDVTDNAKSLEAKIKKDPQSILVAVEKEKVVGAQLIVDDFMPFLFRLAVHPGYRNKGIGTSLMEKGESILKEKGHKIVNILVASDDLTLQKIYQRRGYEKGNTYTWMVKEL